MEGCSDDNLSIDDFLVESRVFAFLVIGDDIGMTFGFEPLPDTELILNCTEQSRFFFGPFATFVENCKNFDLCEIVSVQSKNRSRWNYIPFWVMTFYLIQFLF